MADILTIRPKIVTDDAAARRAEENARRVGRATKQFDTGAAEITRTAQKMRYEAEAAGAAVGRWVGRFIKYEVLRRLAFGFTDVAKQAVELKHVSKELGMSERDIRAWQQAGERVGIPGSRMVQGLQKFRDITLGLKYNVGGVRDELFRMGAGPIAIQMMRTADEAEKLKLAFQFKDQLMKDDPTGFKARMFFEQIGLGVEAVRLSYDQWEKQRAKTRPISDEEQKRMDEAAEASHRLSDQWEHLVRTLSIVFAPPLTGVIWALERVIKLIEELGPKLTQPPGAGGGLKLPPGMFRRSAYGGDEEGSEGPERTIEEGTFKALVRFQAYAAYGGGTGTGAGGGATNAAYSPGSGGGMGNAVSSDRADRAQVGSPQPADGSPAVSVGQGAEPGQGDRPNYLGGTVTVGDQTFNWGSGGPGGRQSIPVGTFPVNLIPSLGGKGQLGSKGPGLGSIATVGGLNGEIPDPKLGRIRTGIQIHPADGRALDALYTQGCFGVTRAQWPAFKAALLAEARKNPDGLFLTVGKDGRASIMGAGEIRTQQMREKLKGREEWSGFKTSAIAGSEGAASLAGGGFPGQPGRPGDFLDKWMLQDPDNRGASADMIDRAITNQSTSASPASVTTDVYSNGTKAEVQTKADGFDATVRQERHMQGVQ